MTAADRAATVTCATCGAVAEPDLTWLRDNDSRGRTRWLCGPCVRRFTRSIESRLDQEWW